MSPYRQAISSIDYNFFYQVKVIVSRVGLLILGLGGLVPLMFGLSWGWTMVWQGIFIGTMITVVVVVLRALYSIACPNNEQVLLWRAQWGHWFCSTEGFPTTIRPGDAWFSNGAEAKTRHEALAHIQAFPKALIEATTEACVYAFYRDNRQVFLLQLTKQQDAWSVKVLNYKTL